MSIKIRHSYPIKSNLVWSKRPEFIILVKYKFI